MNKKYVKTLYRSINDVSEKDPEFNDKKFFMKKVLEIYKNLKEMNIYYIDTFEFTKAIARQLVGWNFFLRIVKKTGDYNNAHYILPRSKRPNEGQVTLFDLGYGFPKELYDRHWCYILKDTGVKFVVLPLTSVKDGSKPNPRYEFDISIKDFQNDKISRLHVDDMRAIDVQRIDTQPDTEIYDVDTDREYIVSEVKRILFTDDMQ